LFITAKILKFKLKAAIMKKSCEEDVRNTNSLLFLAHFVN
jgi:hypothetical protein